MYEKEQSTFSHKDIIINDRLDVDDGFLEVFKIDLNNLIQQYFYVLGDSKVNIEKINNTFNVSITFLSSQVKQFSILPD